MNSELNNRWAILYCPRKGLIRSRIRWERVQKELDAQGVKYDFVQSESTDSVERLMTMLIHNGYQTIVIMGGDTALNDAVNCLMKEEKAVREQVALGVIPNGTLNDFARFWGFNEREDAQTVAWLKKRRVRKVDLGCIIYNDKNGNQQKRYFLNCVNIGLTADIQNMRRQGRQLLGSSTLAFIYSLLLMVFHRHDYKMRLVIDYEVTERNVMTVCVGNALGYGQTPSAVPYSGMLDVSVVYNPKVKQLLAGLWLLVTGRLLNHKSVHPYRIRKMSAESDKALICVDGRPAEQAVGEYHLHVEPEMINFLIPD
jgi:diacylglycerol kinase family enzyme